MKESNLGRVPLSNIVNRAVYSSNVLKEVDLVDVAVHKIERKHHHHVKK